MNYKVERLSSYLNDPVKFDELSERLYYLTDHLSVDYPNHKKWFFEHHLNGVKNGTRDVLFIRNHGNICGIACLKKDDSEKKICTFYVAEHGRNIGIGRELMKSSFEYLKTTTPMITMPSEKVVYFLHFIYKYNWKITQIIEGYYVKGIDEIVINGILK